MKEMYYYSPMKKKYYCEGENICCAKCGRAIELISIMVIHWNKNKSLGQHLCNHCANHIKTQGLISEAKIMLLNQSLPMDAYPIFLKAPNTRASCDVFDAAQLSSISTLDRAKVSKTQHILNQAQFEIDQERLRLQKRADLRLDSTITDIGSYLKRLNMFTPFKQKQLR